MKQILILTLLILLNCNTEPATKDQIALEANTRGDKQESASKILFSRKIGTNRGWSILSINSDGSEEKVLIPFESGMGEYNPDSSPDGSRILFNTYRYGGWKLATYNLRDKTTKRISAGSNYFTNGVYSPNGKMIAYEKNVQRSTHIFVADSDGNNEKMISRNLGNENRIPAWAPDGNSIMFYSEKGKNNDIYAADITGSSITNLTNNASGNDFAPAVSPDGKKVAFFSDRNGYLDLYVMDMDGKNQQNLTSKIRSENNKYNYYKDSNLYWIFKVSWSPDGNSLVFSNVVADNIDLFTIRKDGTDLKQITKTSVSEYTPVWARLKQ